MEDQNKPAFKLKWYWNLYHKFFDKDIEVKVQRAFFIQRIIDKSTSPGILHFYNNRGEKIRGMIDGYNIRFTPNQHHPLTQLAPDVNPLVEKYGYQ